jgi:hypothetical protein
MATRDPMNPVVMRPLEVEVQADPDGKNRNGTYRVRLPWCDCPDMRFRDHAGDDEPHLCKHIRGVWSRTYGWRTLATAEEVTDAATQKTIVENFAKLLTLLPADDAKALLAAANEAFGR